MIDGATETVKHEIKKQEGKALPAFMAPMPASLIVPMASILRQPGASSLVKVIFGKGVSETEGGFLLLLAARLLITSIFGKGVTRAGKGVIRAGRKNDNMDHIDSCSFCSII